MGKMRIAAIACAALVAAWSVRCTTTGERAAAVDDNEKFLQAEKGDGELFRVLYTSDRYVVKQMWGADSIKRSADPGGDTYMCNELKKHDKFNETRESVMSVWLYPDSGSLMKIRPKTPTFLFEIDRTLLEDVQRWSFKFPKKFVTPTRFEIKYRVVLRKTLSDQEIMKELREKLQEKS
ncbi:MAG TPA: hypothetical protein PKY31_01805 [Spirochaetota bacterium]|nr:hypothetical protein [Spirochaetota bacterium]